MLNIIIDTLDRFGNRMLIDLIDTFFMVSVAFFVAFVLGTTIGFLLALCGQNRPYAHKNIAIPLSLLVNIIRSVPFILLLIVMAPLARFFIGTAYGIYASMISLSVVGVAIVSRLVEQAIIDVSPHIYESAHSMGATRTQLVTQFILVEARSALVLGYTSAIISLIAYSTVVGVIAGGGIGYLALQEGFYMWNQPLMWMIIVVMMILVQVIQVSGSWLAHTLDRKRKTD